jgi:hypothetical protein
MECYIPWGIKSIRIHIFHLKEFQIWAEGALTICDKLCSACAWLSSLQNIFHLHLDQN